MVERPNSILIIEDPLIRKLIAGILTRAGYRITESDQPEGVEKLRKQPRDFCLLITNRPQDFLEFAETVPLLYIAAMPDLELASRFRRCGVLRKHFHPVKMLELATALAGPVVP